MPGFVKTARDERVWAKAKNAAMGQYPNLSEDRKFAAANHIFHSMKGSSKRIERNGNPGEPVLVDQYPDNGKEPPFNKMEKYWQPDVLAVARGQERNYEKGARKPMSREIPLLGGGTGKVVGSARASELARPRAFKQPDRNASERSGR